MSRWGIGLSEKMKACKEAEPFTDILEGDGGGFLKRTPRLLPKQGSRSPR